MSFRDGIAGWSERVQAKNQRVFVGICTEVHRSIVDGSEITNAPGQPRRTGRLAASWIPEFIDEHTFQDTTDAPYAIHVEENERGVTFQNHGPHSVALTRAGFPAIVAAVVAREAGR